MNERTSPNLGISLILYGKYVLVLREIHLHCSFNHKIRELSVYVRVKLPHTCREVTDVEGVDI